MSQTAESEQKVLLFDPEKCTGCRYCEVGCAFYHQGVVDPSKSNIHIFLKGGEFAFEATNCQHCREPPCENSCPEDAIKKDSDTGWVKVDSMKCTGCKACITACPLSCPWFDEEHQIAQICDFCDGEPVCVDYCSPGALSVVTRAEAEEFMKNRYGGDNGSD